jgi:hypothetical protein
MKRTSGYYILRGKKPVPVDASKWAFWYEKADRHVAKDTIGEVYVSTVFLGLGMCFEDTPTDLFETMTFGGEYDQYQRRYATWDEAKAGHDQVVLAITEGRDPNSLL